MQTVLVSIVPQCAKAEVEAVRFSFTSSTVCRGWSQSCSFRFPVVPQYAKGKVKAVRFGFPTSTVCRGRSQSCSFRFPLFLSMQRLESKLFVSVSVVPQYAEAGVKAVRFGFP